MESHRPPPRARRPLATATTREDAPSASARARRTPLDEGWLEQEGMRHAARWETSRRDLAAKLEQKLLRRCERSGEDPEDWRARIPDVVARLAEQGYVDDRRLGRLLVARLRREGRSTQRILAQLERRGVPDEIARELVEDLEPAAAREREIDAAFRLARRRRIGPYTPDPDRREADRERHLAILGRQGFSLETALCVVDAESPGSLE